MYVLKGTLLAPHIYRASKNKSATETHSFFKNTLRALFYNEDMLNLTTTIIYNQS